MPGKSFPFANLGREPDMGLNFPYFLASQLSLPILWCSKSLQQLVFSFRS